MNKEELLANLYVLRAGISKISINKEDYDKYSSKNKYNEEKLNKITDDIEINKKDLEYYEKENDKLSRKDFRAEANDAYRREKSKLEKKINKKDNDFLKSRVILNGFIIILGICLLIGLGLFFYWRYLDNAIKEMLDWAEGDISKIENYNLGVVYKNIIFVAMIVIPSGGFIAYLVKLIINLKNNLEINKRNTEKRNKIKSKLSNLDETTFIANYLQEKNRINYLKISDNKNKIKQINSSLNTLELDKTKTMTNLTETRELLDACIFVNSVLYNSLVKTYSFLDPRDYKNLDLVIYYIETNRADDIKEALQLVDKKIEMNELKSLIIEATKNITSTINNNTMQLASYMNNCFNNLANNISLQNKEILKSINSYQSTVNNKIDYLSREINYNKELNNALISRISVSSETLAKDVSYMRNLAEDAEIRRRNNM